MRHAYLIIAHTEFKLLENLVSILDYPNNDIFIHIDKKVEYCVKYMPKHAHLYHVEEANRVDIRWGDCTQIYSELALYKLAHQYGPYDYYHLMSGICMPIKTQAYIQDYFKRHQGTEFIGLMPNAWRTYKKMMYYHLFTKHLRGFGIRSKAELLINSLLVKMQELLHITRSEDGLEEVLDKGSNLSSLTEAAVSYILSKESFIRKRFVHTFACDEVYKPTLLMNSSFAQKLYNKEDEYEGCRRLVDWKRGNPYIWQNENYDEIMQSEMLFARKFSSKHFDLVEKLTSYLKNHRDDISA